CARYFPQSYYGSPWAMDYW
nr:immunoglobulin heavy chain junction region [Mus musculus]